MMVVLSAFRTYDLSHDGPLCSLRGQTLLRSDLVRCVHLNMRWMVCVPSALVWLDVLPVLVATSTGRRARRRAVV